MDAQAALDFISTREDLDASKVCLVSQPSIQEGGKRRPSPVCQVMLLGKSLGGAVAIHLAAANPTRVQALLVENTFTSIEDVAPRVRDSADAHI